MRCSRLLNSRCPVEIGKARATESASGPQERLQTDGKKWSKEKQPGEGQKRKTRGHKQIAFCSHQDRLLATEDYMVKARPLVLQQLCEQR